MMLEIAILGGPKLQANRPFQLANVTVVILLLGFGATVSKDIFLKFALFGCGAAGFVVLAHLMDRVVEEHTEGDTRLFAAGSKSGKSTPLKALLLKVLATWIGFPIWWAMSPDGFNVVEDRDLHSGIFLLLNIVAKAVFIWYVYTLDYELPSDKGAAKLPDEHPDLKQEQSPSAKETEDLEGGRRSSSTDEGSDGKRYLPEQDKLAKLFAERERYLEDRMKELQDRERQHHEDRERHLERMLDIENSQRMRMMHAQIRAAPRSEQDMFSACCQKNSEDDDATYEYAPISPTEALHLSNPADGTARDFVQANNLARADALISA
jgi:hypothetical protein